MGQKYKLRKTDVFGQCLMSSGNVSCFRAMSHVIGQCLMFSGRMFSGNVSCHRAMSHVFGPYVFGQCLMFSGNVSCHRAGWDKIRIRMVRIRTRG